MRNREDYMDGLFCQGNAMNALQPPFAALPLGSAGCTQLALTLSQGFSLYPTKTVRSAGVYNPVAAETASRSPAAFPNADRHITRTIDTFPASGRDVDSCLSQVFAPRRMEVIGQ
jgi:hypothetical protein